MPFCRTLCTSSSLLLSRKGLFFSRWWKGSYILYCAYDVSLHGSALNLETTAKKSQSRRNVASFGFSKFVCSMSQDQTARSIQSEWIVFRKISSPRHSPSIGPRALQRWRTRSQYSYPSEGLLMSALRLKSKALLITSGTRTRLLDTSICVRLLGGLALGKDKGWWRQHRPLSAVEIPGYWCHTRKYHVWRSDGQIYTRKSVTVGPFWWGKWKRSV